MEIVMLLRAGCRPVEASMFNSKAGRFSADGALIGHLIENQFRSRSSQ
jgi:hypothetical protein